MRKLIFISILILLIGCGTFQLTTLNHDPLYHIPDSNIQVEVLDTEFDLDIITLNSHRTKTIVGIFKIECLD